MRAGSIRHIAVGVLTLAFVFPADAMAFSNLFVFGDSLVDTGNVQALALNAGAPDPTPAELGYFEGRFTNGINAADVVNQAIESTNLAGSLTSAMGDNFAYGGARARTNTDAIPDLAAQISAYFLVRSLDPDALYLINVGGNDVRDIALEGLSGAQRELRIADATAAVAAAVSALQAEEVNHIAFVGIADVGAIPEMLALGSATSADATRASIDLNASIVAALPEEVQVIDTIGLFDAVAAAPGSFGLPEGIDQESACLDSAFPDPSGAPTCTDFVFFDPVHPTTAIHQILGAHILATVPEPSVASSLFACLVGLAATRGRSGPVNVRPEPTRNRRIGDQVACSPIPACASPSGPRARRISRAGPV